MTTADILREQGRVAGLRVWLLKLLTQRFGVLPADAVTRVMTANSGELEASFDRGLTAATLAEVLGEG